MRTNIINNFILIGLLAVIAALVSVGAVEIEARPVTGVNILAAARRPKRKGSRLAGSIAAVHQVPPVNENPLERALREAGRTQDNSATLLDVDGVGILFRHTSRAYETIRKILQAVGPSGRVTATGTTENISSLPYEFAGTGIQRCLTGLKSVRFENIDLEGQHAEYWDVVITNDGVVEAEREIEVPMPGYCLRCRQQVYRNGVELVYVPREGYYHSGLDLHRDGTDDLAGDPYYIPATIGECTICGGNSMTFGAALTRTVLSREYVSGDVPGTDEPIQTPKPEKSAMLYSVGYCMGCRADVSRREVRLVTLGNGTQATVGTCPRQHCGRTVYRMGGPVGLEVVRQMDAITGLGFAFAYLLPRFVDKRFAWGKEDIDCDFSGCFAFASRRGYRTQRVPTRKQGLVLTTPAAFCDDHHAQMQQMYEEKAAGRAA